MRHERGCPHISAVACNERRQAQNDAGLGLGGEAGGQAGVGGEGGAAGEAGGPWIEPVDGGVACKNLECRQSKCKYGFCSQPVCPEGTFTTLSGKVYDPAGKVPLYNVNVYIPNEKLTPLVDGPACDSCGMGLVGAPLVQTKTAADGSFTLGDPDNDVPRGPDVPLVIQVGKWRREATIKNVAGVHAQRDRRSRHHAPAARQDRRPPAPHRADHRRLGRARMPAAQGRHRRLGVHERRRIRRVNLFAGTNGTDAFSREMGGEHFSGVEPWWDDLKNLMKYDIIVHSCDGIEIPNNKSMAARQALKDYADMGGRVFASHWHIYWFEHGPAPFPNIATFNHQPDLPPDYPVKIDTSFEKGRAMAEWIDKVGGSSMFGELGSSAAGTPLTAWALRAAGSTAKTRPRFSTWRR